MNLHRCHFFPVFTTFIGHTQSLIPILQWKLSRQTWSPLAALCSNLHPLLHVPQVAAFILTESRYWACLSSSHTRLVCAYLRHSTAPLIYQIFGLPDASQSPHLFLKFGHQTEQFNCLTLVCFLLPSISRSRTRHSPRAGWLHELLGAPSGWWH